MARRRSTKKRQYVRGKGVRCRRPDGRFTKCGRGMSGAHAGLTDIGELGFESLAEVGSVGGVDKVAYIPGKGMRCWDERGKFTSCALADVGDIGDLDDLGRTRRRKPQRKSRRKSTSKRRVARRIMTPRGRRCFDSRGKFTKC